MKDEGADLYRRFTAGDTGALEQLVELYSDGLVRFAYGYLRDEAAAEDVSADTFAALLVRRKHFKEQAQFKTYLYKIARNRAIDFLRARKRLLPLGEQSSPSDAEDILLLRERKRVLYENIRKLPPQYAEILRLHYFEDFSVSEICRILRKSPKQVYNLLNRAKLTLKNLLCKEGIPHENV